MRSGPSDNIQSDNKTEVHNEINILDENAGW